MILILLALLIGAKGAVLFDLQSALGQTVEFSDDEIAIDNVMTLQVDRVSNGSWSVRNGEVCALSQDANVIALLDRPSMMATESGHMSFIARLFRWNAYLHVRANGMFHVEVDFLSRQLTLFTRATQNPTVDKFFLMANRVTLQSWDLTAFLPEPLPSLNFTVDLQFDWRPFIDGDDEVDMTFKWRLLQDTSQALLARGETSFRRRFFVVSFEFQTMGQWNSRHCITGWTVSDQSERTTTATRSPTQSRTSTTTAITTTTTTSTASTTTAKTTSASPRTTTRAPGDSETPISADPRTTTVVANDSSTSISSSVSVGSALISGGSTTDVNVDSNGDNGSTNIVIVCVVLAIVLLVLLGVAGFIWRMRRPKAMPRESASQASVSATANSSLVYGESGFSSLQ
jgi:hypothetical protein